jgi:hypothetical protein
MPGNGSDGQRKTAVLILSHVIDKDIATFFKNMKEECGKYYDVVFLCDNSNGVFDAYKDHKDYFLFTTEQLEYLEYPGKSEIVYEDESRDKNPHHKNFNFVPGSIELPVMYYFHNRPGYQHYWVVEYDVRFSGSWRRLFTAFADSDADLLATTLTRYAAIPDWYHWGGLDLGGLPVSEDDYLRAFLPLYRISNRALARLDGDYRRGVAGHFECLGPTLLHHAGLNLEDIGGDGEFVRPENRNRFYRNTPTADTLAPGSFVFRPVMDRAGKQRDTLWHPVKYTPPWRAALRQAKRLIRS